MCQVCDSPLVEMLDEAENSEASTIECSEDEEWIENIGSGVMWVVFWFLVMRMLCLLLWVET